jgi:hypothetical protein
MAKKNRKKNQSGPRAGNGATQSQGAKPATQSPPASATPIITKTFEDLKLPSKDSESLAKKVDEVVKNPQTPAPDRKIIEDAIKQLEKLTGQLQDIKNKEDERRVEAAKLKKDAEAELAAAKEKKDQAAADVEKVEQSRKQLDAREKKLNARHEELLKREADAEAGFLDKARECFSSLESKKKELQDKLVALDHEISTRQNEIDARQSDEIKAAWEELRAKQAELKNLQADVAGQEEACALKESRLVARLASIEEAIEKAAAERIIELTEEKERTSQRVEKLLEENKRLNDDLTAFEEISQRLDGRSAEETVALIGDLKNENRELQIKLDRSGGAELMARHDQLKDDLRAAEDQKFSLERELQQVKQRLSSAEIMQLQQESVKYTNEALKTHNEVLGEAVNQVKEELSELKQKSADRPVFGELVKLDANKEYSARKTFIGRETKETLSDFTDAVRNNMALDRYYYSKETLQIFIGGLAMSRLHILQGISGTGKTSLAMEFAKVVGGEESCQKVEVQAGWRDSQDLIGYYNAFEHKYYEKDTTIGLYKAHMPALEDRPFIMLLDEMNLSHTEYYFADFLSKLEDADKQDELKIRLATGLPDIQNAPKWLSADGEHLIIPDNVWFIGTANHDETTMEFAPKTYDRAHVMTLARHPAQFSPKARMNSQWSFGDLRDAFKDAKDKYKGKAEKMLEILEDEVGLLLEDKFEVKWGNRLERQLQSFVPVVVACGGSEGLALDHILQTKLLRKGKIVGRFDTAAGDLEDLKKAVDSCFKQYKFDPSKSEALKLLEKEIKRVGGRNV